MRGIQRLHIVITQFTSSDGTREFINMDAREKGLLIALIDQRIREEQKQIARAKRKRK